MNWFLLAMKNTFDFKGRARRREFCWFTLIGALISWGLQFLAGAAGALNLPLLAQGISFVYLIFFIIMVIPSCSVTVRRLHDLGYSGWWLLLFYALFGMIFVLSIFALKSEYGLGIAIIICIILVILCIFSLFLSFKDGQKHPNKYGDSPKYTSQVIEQKITDLTV